MASTVDNEGNISTESQSESYANESVTTSTPNRIISLVPYDIASVAVGTSGIFANGIVLVGFWLARRSKMTSTMFYIANQTTLVFLACVMITIKRIMGFAGVFRYNDSGPSAMAMCILLDGATLFTLGFNGSTACLVIMTLDRYWKIVHAVHHRNHYRRWMLRVGLFLPWLNGVAVHLLPAIGTARIIDGICEETAAWPSDAMAQGYGAFLFLWQFFIPLVIFITAYWRILGVVKGQRKVASDGVGKPANLAGTSRGTTDPEAIVVGSDKNKGKQKVSNGHQGAGSQDGQKKLSQTQINVVKTMVYITVCFTLCWMPMYIYVILMTLGDPAGRMVMIVAYSQILVDPLIYISRYEVVKRSLGGFVHRATAFLREPAATIDTQQA